MRRFRDWSIRSKLAFIVLSTSVIALALASAAMIAADRVTIKEEMVHNAGTVADVITTNSTAALAFNNRADAMEVLASLRYESHITQAVLVDHSGAVFASYPADLSTADLPFRFTDPDGHWFGADQLHLVRTVRLEDRPLGRLYLSAHLGVLADRLRLWLLTVAGVSLAALAVAFLATQRLQSAVSRPLNDLAQVAQRVSQQRDYSVRARAMGADEVGLLVTTFNDMLSQIEERDAALREAQSTLEDRVRDRTLELENEVAERRRSEEQRKQLQTMLERAERMKTVGVLAGGVAHDLNNMLGPVVGYAELVQRDLEDRPELSRRLDRVIRAACNAAEVIQDLLMLGRRGRYDFQAVQLNDVITSYLDSPACERLREIHPDVSLEPHLQDQLPQVAGSIPHLTKVITNVVVNACEAMPAGGRLAIRTGSEVLSALKGGFDKIPNQEYVIVSIQDEGLGISPEDLDRVFEPYFSKKKMGRGGTGLGLSVVYGVVKDHHGFVDVLSREGLGTEILLYFPTYTPDEDTETMVREGLEGQGVVLVVDDHEDQRDLACSILESLGYQVHAVTNGHEAVEHLKANRVDVVVLDMLMEPGFDGLDTYREIRRLHPDQKAIVVSGYSETERAQAVHRLGAGAYVRKPYTVETIGRAVKEQLAGVRSVSAGAAAAGKKVS